MKNQLTKMLVVFVGLFMLSGCAATQKIGYKLDDIETVKAPPPSCADIVFDVQAFEDIRQTVKENEIVFTKDKSTKKNDRTVCINSEKYYEKGAVAYQIACAISDHLNKRGSFKLVTVNKKEEADYYLTGNLKRFYGEQGYSTSASAGAQFGLLGALLTAGAKTKGFIVIKFTDLAIHDKSGNVLKRLDDISEKFEGDFPADAYCWCIYRNCNDKLKAVVDQLARDIEGVI